MAAKKAAVDEEETTGRYAFCPYSNTGHPLFAVQVVRGPKSYWFMCTCGTRVYFPKKKKLVSMTRDQALAMGAQIPSELGGDDGLRLAYGPSGLSPGPFHGR